MKIQKMGQGAKGNTLSLDTVMKLDGRLSKYWYGENANIGANAQVA